MSHPLHKAASEALTLNPPTVAHTKDGATSYRLDWNGKSLCYTGDNRPNSLTIKHCKGVDMLIVRSDAEPSATNLAAPMRMNSSPNPEPTPASLRPRYSELLPAGITDTRSASSPALRASL